MSGDVSPAAQAANRRLHEMRAQLAAGRGAAGHQTAVGPHDAASHSLFSNPPAPPSHTPAAPNPSSDFPPLSASPSAQPPWSSGGGQTIDSHSESTRALIETLRRLPPHLGWGSETLTAHLRKLRMTNDELRIAEGEGEKGGKGEGGRGGEAAHALATHALATHALATHALATHALATHALAVHDHNPPNSSLVTRRSSLKIYPDIALGMLREERAAAGRVWLLLRHLDAPGRGMVALADARAALTAKESPLRLCGWRRLRQLLAEGEGVFWIRERGRVAEPKRPDRFPKTCQVSAYEDRLRLLGPARVAAALGVRRLVGRPVGVPLSAFLGSIGDARAHLYATFHSSRVREEWTIGAGEKGRKGAGAQSSTPAPPPPCAPASSGSPIARDTLTTLSGACARSQAAYERRTGVCSRSNVALGERVAAGAPTGPAEQERAWQRGRALFRLRDHRGHHGRPGATYLAWRLPNAFGPARGHQPRPKGRQKRINRQLADLFTKGMTGNGERIEKRFYASAAAAYRAGEQGSRGAGEQSSRLSCRPGNGHYWPLTNAGRGACRLWAMVQSMDASSSGAAAAPRQSIPRGLQSSFFDNEAGKELRGL